MQCASSLSQRLRDHYSSYVSRSLSQLRQGNYADALDQLEKPNGKTNMLLYRLERGLIFHYQGLYAQSNAEFERAERLIDRLYTRSVSREAAAFLTNDAIVAYRGEEFERVFIHYFRALNYERLGDRQAVQRMPQSQSQTRILRPAVRV